MTINDIVTSTSPSISRSFTGDLDLPDAPVAVSVVFAEGSVRLLLAGDIVGSWPLAEVQFVPAESGYELVAEGDSLTFLPHDRNAFASFVLDEPEEEPPPSSAPIEDQAVTDPGGAPAAESEMRPAGLRADDEPGYHAGLEPEFTALEKSPTSLLDLDDEPDEFFAAGLNGPPSESAPTFRSPLFGAEPLIDGEDAEPGDTATPQKEAMAGPHDDETQDEAAVPEMDDEPIPSFGLGRFEGETPTVNGHGDPRSKEPVNGYEPELDDIPERPETLSEPSEGPIASSLPHESALVMPPEPVLSPEAAPSLPPEPAPSLPPEPVPSLPPELAPSLPSEPARESDGEPAVAPYETPEWADDPSDVPSSSTPEPAAPATDYPEYGSDDSETLDVPEAEDAVAGGFLGRFRARVSSPKGPEVQEQEQEQRVDSGASLTGDDTPQPIDDAENLRQWGLVAAGGLVITVVAVMVIWGLASILGGDTDPVVESAPATTVATAPPETAPPPEPTTPTVVSIAPSPENIAVAQAFVSDWNSLASQYANQLSISADSLPISVAPEPTIHLTYEEDGILRLKMAPRGNGNDRDILLAMGLAVAWADPTVSPEGRKSLLADLGVDVDNPVLTDMGGEVSRSGTTYRTSVDEAILTFEVDPAG